MRDQMGNSSPKTLNTHWTRRFQSFTRSKPPEVLDTEDVKAFLTDLTVCEHVSASWKRQSHFVAARSDHSKSSSFAI